LDKKDNQELSIKASDHRFG